MSGATYINMLCGLYSFRLNLQKMSSLFVKYAEYRLGIRYGLIIDFVFEHTDTMLLKVSFYVILVLFPGFFWII